VVTRAISVPASWYPALYILLYPVSTAVPGHNPDIKDFYLFPYLDPQDYTVHTLPVSSNRGLSVSVLVSWYLGLYLQQPPEISGTVFLHRFWDLELYLYLYPGIQN
jgi:hypothetical protein